MKEVRGKLMALMKKHQMDTTEFSEKEMDRRLAFWRSVKFKKAAFLAVGTGVILFMAFGGQEKRRIFRLVKLTK